MPTESQILQELTERVEKLEAIKHKNILELPKLPTLSMDDTIMVVSASEMTGKSSLEALMQYLNENLKNFICWKPVVTDKTLSWERSSNDEAPQPINFNEIIFPMASDVDDGMITSEMYTKIESIDALNIVYADRLAQELEGKAPVVHTHDQYQLISEMPTKLSQFENDTKYLVKEDLPTKVSEFENDKEFITNDTANRVSDANDGFMTTELFNILNNINESYVTSTMLSTQIEAVTDIIPKKVSQLTNDSKFVKESLIQEKFGELGAVNLIDNSKFMNRQYTAWSVYNATLDLLTDDNYGSCGKITFTSSDSELANSVTPYIGSTYTISFIAKANRSAKLSMKFVGVTNDVELSDSWKIFTYKITRDPSVTDHFLTFKPSTDESMDESIELYLTNVKVERGEIKTDYSMSYIDIVDLSAPATNDIRGTVRPDGATVYVDPADGLLKARLSGISGGIINDDAVYKDTTYSSSKIEEELAKKASLVDGKIPSEQLPSYVDDVVEGTMNEEGTEFTISPGQQTSGDPAKGKIYLDVDTNTSYRWTGTKYTAIGGSAVPMVGATTENDGLSGLVPTPKKTDVDKFLKGDGTWSVIESKTEITDELILSKDSWTDNSQTVSVVHDINKRNSIDVETDDMENWVLYGVYADSETNNDITFKCRETPQVDLRFRLSSASAIQATNKYSHTIDIYSEDPDIEAIPNGYVYIKDENV